MSKRKYLAHIFAVVAVMAFSGSALADPATKLVGASTALKDVCEARKDTYVSKAEMRNAPIYLIGEYARQKGNTQETMLIIGGKKLALFLYYVIPVDKLLDVHVAAIYAYHTKTYFNICVGAPTGSSGYSTLTGIELLCRDGEEGIIDRCD